jgi:hypothetical protein
LSDGHRPGIEIDVRPTQPEHFRAAKSGERQQPAGVQAVVAHVMAEQADLFGCAASHFVTLDRRALHQAR